MGTVISDSFKVNDLSFDGYFFGGSLVVMVSKHYLIDCVKCKQAHFGESELFKYNMYNYCLMPSR